MRNYRWLAFLVLVLAVPNISQPDTAHAGCVVEGTVVYAEGASIRDDKCDTTGAKKVTTSGTSSISAVATAAAPTYLETAISYLSLTLQGALRVTLETLIAGEDLVNNLLMVSGGAARVTQILGTGGVPSTATDGTSATSILPIGKKTFHGRITCTGTCIQTQKIYGNSRNTAGTDGELLGTITLNDTTNAHVSIIIDSSWMYYSVVTTLTAGTTPLSEVEVTY
jgi:hypothetical protein